MIPAWRERIKGLLRGTPAKPSAARKSPAEISPKTYASSDADRTEAIKQAMTVYRSRRGEVHGLLDKALKEMREKPPKAVSEHDELVRLLTLHRAHVVLKALMSHDLRQYLVFSGIRGLLEDVPGKLVQPERCSPAPAGKAGRRRVSKR